MTSFLTFAVSFGGLLCLSALIAAWLFRTTSAPLILKIAIPSSMVALACYAPYSILSMMGFPVTAAMRDLPQTAELVAFAPDDDGGLVDLWLRTCPPPCRPRAYETKLDDKMKETLRAAQGEMGQGRPAMLKKGVRGPHKAGDPLGIGGDESEFVLDESVITALPPKE